MRSSTPRSSKPWTHGANFNPEASLAPLREGVASTRVSLFGSILAAFTISFSHCACDLVYGLESAHGMPQGISLLQDTVKRAANRANNEAMRVQKERESSECHPPGGKRAGGGHPHRI
jgi:hypothetical protein